MTCHCACAVSIINRQRKFTIDRDALCEAVCAVLEACGQADQEVNVVLVSDRTMRTMNRDYRGRNEPTDVISFAMKEGEFGDPSGTILGDLVVSLETIRRQCTEPFDDSRPETGTPQRELALMVIHGLLHLMGHDHEQGPKKARRMVAEERRLFDLCWEKFPGF
jgi:probable rRNA maturation factor